MNVLLEIGVEELPASFLEPSLKFLNEYLSKNLKEARISFGEMKTYGTPRRLIVNIDSVAELQEDLNQVNIGPSVSIAYNEDGSLTRTGLGFAKSKGISPQELTTIKNEKGEYIAVEKFQKGEASAEVLKDIFKEAILGMTFPKSMRWGVNPLRFGRPIKWILALAGDDIIDFSIGDVVSGRSSKGHRFFGSDFVAESPEDYFKMVEAENVIIDIDRRKAMIREGVESLVGEDEMVQIDESLLSEVTNLVEYPFPILGTFNQAFLEVPQEILIISMKVHQRYFPVLDTDGNLLPKFIVVRNGIEASESVRRGNEKVLAARLSDARFFFQEDLKTPLIENLEKLKKVIFQQKLGSIYDKLQRMVSIANIIENQAKTGIDMDDIKGAVLLSKCDLPTNMIGEKEFAKLQGYIGHQYALKGGVKPSIALAIEEHYLPKSQNGKLPSALEGALVGLADRFDTLVGCFAVGIIPSGSKDPYALRRAAIGIVNIIREFKLDISLKEVVSRTLITLENEGRLERPFAEVESDVLEFLKQRIINVLVGKDYNKEYLLATMEHSYDNIIHLQKKVEVITKNATSESFKEITHLVKRIANITSDDFDGNVEVDLFTETAESNLYSHYLKIHDEVFDVLQVNDYQGYLDIILSSKDYIDTYFEQVKVMVEDEKLKTNRLRTLYKLNHLFNLLLNFNSLEG